MDRHQVREPATAMRTMTNRRLVTLLVAFVLLLSTGSTRASGSSEEEDASSTTFTDQWAVHITGGEEVANAIAARHGFTNLGKVSRSIRRSRQRSNVRRPPRVPIARRWRAKSRSNSPVEQSGTRLKDD